MELTGKIKVIYEAKKYDSGFEVRKFVLTIHDGNYPQDIILELHKDNVAKLDRFEVGDEITVAINVRGREYKGSYFNSLVAWRLRSAAHTVDKEDKPARGRYAPEDEDNDAPF